MEKVPGHGLCTDYRPAGRAGFGAIIPALIPAIIPALIPAIVPCHSLLENRSFAVFPIRNAHVGRLDAAILSENHALCGFTEKNVLHRSCDAHFIFENKL